MFCPFIFFTVGSLRNSSLCAPRHSVEMPENLYFLYFAKTFWNFAFILLKTVMETQLMCHSWTGGQPQR